jgi:hypothetical protein
MRDPHGWADWLAAWNEELVVRLERDARDPEGTAYAARLDDADLTPHDVAARWLGRPGADEGDIAALEARLGARLPPSYTAFLRASDGWRVPYGFVPQIRPAARVDWLATRDQTLIDQWCGGDAAADLAPGAGLPSVPDAEYFVYDDRQAEHAFRPEYLQTALAISDEEVGGSARYLLNPRVVTADGEWEAWMLAHWLPGARRYRSFRDLMRAVRRDSLDAD